MFSSAFRGGSVKGQWPLCSYFLHAIRETCPLAWGVRVLRKPHGHPFEPAQGLRDPPPCWSGCCPVQGPLNGHRIRLHFHTWINLQFSCMGFMDGKEKNNTAPQLNRKESAKHRIKMRKGVRNGKEQKTPFSENVFSDIYSPLMLNTKSEISPTPLETNTYKLKSKTVTMQIKVDPNM